MKLLTLCTQAPGNEDERNLTEEPVGTKISLSVFQICGIYMCLRARF